MNTSTPRLRALQKVVSLLQGQLHQAQYHQAMYYGGLFAAVAHDRVAEKHKKYVLMVAIEESLQKLTDDEIQALLKAGLSAGYDAEAAQRHLEIYSLVANGVIEEEAAAQMHLWNL